MPCARSRSRVRPKPADYRVIYYHVFRVKIRAFAAIFKFLQKTPIFFLGALRAPISLCFLCKNTLNPDNPADYRVIYYHVPRTKIRASAETCGLSGHLLYHVSGQDPELRRNLRIIGVIIIHHFPTIGGGRLIMVNAYARPRDSRISQKLIN